MATSTDNRPRRRVGVLGGSFNPPHIGHLVIASQAFWQARLDTVCFVPAWSPPHKIIDDRVSAGTRLDLTRAAIADDPRFSSSTVEIDRHLRYSIDTLAALADLLAPAELWFIIGSDSLLALPTWRSPERLPELARLAVAPRPGDDETVVAAAAARAGALLLDSPPLAVSSTDVRRRVRMGMPIRYLVPAAVERLIERDGLYRAAGNA